MRAARLICLLLFVLALPGAALADTTVQGSQSTSDASSTSGGTTGGNSSSFNGGPSASGSDSSAQQKGSNHGSVSQSGSGSAGDSVAGSQVAGATGDNVTVQNQNSSSGATATGGDATITNDAAVRLGPEAVGRIVVRQEIEQAQCVNGCPFDQFGFLSEPGPAHASQIGDNDLAVSQAGAASSGDAVGGGQITGTVASGSSVVQNQNAATDATAASGDAATSGTLVAQAGPLAVGAIGIQKQDQRQFCFDGTCIQQAEQTATVPGAQAGAVQTGDNAVTTSQTGTAGSGDAVAGAQVTGSVARDATVQNQNNASAASAISGNAVVDADVDVEAGPTAVGVLVFQDANQVQRCAIGNCVQVSEQTVDVEEAGPALASQIGDNAVDAAQAADAASGDAVASGQVTGTVAELSTVQNQNASADSSATTGTAVVSGNAHVTAGPVAANVLAVQVQDQDQACTQGADCVQVQSQTVNASPAEPAMASQTGDNFVALAQYGAATSGDAVAGSQVTGAVGGLAIIQNQNSSAGDVALSGDSFVDNAASAEAGPSAALVRGEQSQNQASACTTGAECAQAQTQTVAAEGDAAVHASQIGDNAIDVSQAGRASTGDAVAGGQVTGAVAEATIQNQNAATDPLAATGAASADNSVSGAAGPQAAPALRQGTQSRSDTCVDASCANAQTQTASPGGATALASQNGANVTAADQATDTTSGDAVSGSQVSGVVEGEGPRAAVVAAA